MTGYRLTPEEQDQQRKIERRRMMANMLVQQSMQPMGGTQNVGGFAVRRSPMEGMAKLAQAASGSYLKNKADEEASDLSEGVEGRRKSQYERIAKAYDPTNVPGYGGGTHEVDPRIKLAQAMAGEGDYESATNLYMKAADKQGDKLLRDNKAPVVKDFYNGDQVTQKQWNPTTNQWDEVGSGARWNPREENDEPAPSNVREYQFYQSLSDEEKDIYLRVKRASKVLDTGSAFEEVAPAGGATEKLVDKTRTPEQIEKRQQEAKATKKSVDYAVNELKRFRDDAKDLLNHPGRAASTGASAWLGYIPATDAKDAAAKLDVIKNKSFITALGAMRAASKTGGAVGNVSNLEGQRFENAFVALDRAQSDEQFASELRSLVEITDNMINEMEGAYRTEFSDIIGEDLENKPPPTNNSQSNDPLGIR